MSPEQLIAPTALMAAALGLAAAFWGKLKTLAWRILNLVVVRITVEDTAAPAVADYLWRHGRRSRYGERAYAGANLFVRPADRQIHVAYEQMSNDAVVFWLGLKPLLAGFHGQAIGGTFMGMKLTITFVRGMFDADELVRRAVDEMNRRHHGGEAKRFTVHRLVGRAGRSSRQGGGAGRPGMTSISEDSSGMPVGTSPAGESSGSGGRRYLGWTESDIGPPVLPDPLGPLAFPPAVDELVEEARRWLASERWYKDRRIPWRLGWLFHGRPGTGKSSLARAVAAALDLPIFVFELATMDDGEFIHFFRKALSESPSLVLFEDFDATFKGRDNRLGERGGGLSFGCVINSLSGVEGADGVLVVVTTNHPEDLDPAIGSPTPAGDGRTTRPGRMSRAVELGPLDADCRRRVAARILADCPGEIDAVVAAGDGETGDQFQERCRSLALRWHWERAGPAGSQTEGKV